MELWRASRLECSKEWLSCRISDLHVPICGVGMSKRVSVGRAFESNAYHSGKRGLGFQWGDPREIIVEHLFEEGGVEGVACNYVL